LARGRLTVLAMNKISQQLIALVFVALVVFSVGAATIIGYQSYSDSEEVALERVKGAASLFGSDFEAAINRAYNSLADVESNQVIAEQLVLLNNYGPLYTEDKSQQGQDLSDADISFYFQSQLKLARALVHLLPINDLKELALYHTDPFHQYESAEPLPSIIINHKEIWFYRYASKSASPSYSVYRLPISQLNYEGDFFDVSSVYQYDADYFYNAVGVEVASKLPFDQFRQLNRPKSYSAGQVVSLLQDKLRVAIWSPVTLSLTNPETWEATPQYAAIIVGIHEPSNSGLSAVASRLGAEIAIVDQEHVWVSSITHKAQSHENDVTTDTHLSVNEDPYIFSEIKLELPSDDDFEFKIMALSPTAGLIARTEVLITRLTVITLVAILITGLAFYILVRKKLRDPLEDLMNGVMRVRQGDLDTQVQIKANNELGTLGAAFNDMTQQLQQQESELKKANDTLEHKVRARTEELQNAQQQLILAEKMASLGQLVAGVAHEINTPLGNSITALSYNRIESEQIQKKFDEKSLTITDFGKFLKNSHESMDIMDTNLRKASQLVQTFKNVAVNQSVEEVVNFSMKEHVDEVLVTLRPQLKKTQVNVHVKIDDDLVIDSYPGAYYHIISNMIVNSLRHAFPENQGIINLSIHAEGDSLHLHYQDNGCGMDENVKAKIFDPFFTTRRGDGGTGLGMYMTYNIVTQRLGGKIEVLSELNKGTQFDIVVPLEIPDAQQDEGYFSVN